jgi:eukaryotic-like serine/threonine-protein kinase
LLVGESSEQRAKNAASLTPSSSVDGWLVIRPIQVLEDTEVYQVRGPGGEWGALKIGRAGDQRAKWSLSHETQFLSSISVASAPRVLASGDFAKSLYLVTEWISGIDVQSAAAEYRMEDKDASRNLLQLGSAILEAYAALHEAGLLHGDIHPRNALVDRHQSVKLVDFGLACVAGAGHDGIRGGVSFFFEPEYARAALDAMPQPAPTFAGEQYALAALLYLLITGSHSQDFSLERSEMLRQISTGAMAPFAKRGIKPWPEVEQILATALSKDPGARFPSVREFAQAWQAVDVPAEISAPAPVRPSQLDDLRREVLRQSAIPGSNGAEGLWMQTGFDTAPRASLNAGYAGLAYSLYRIASAAGDGELLAAADAWSARSIREMDSDGAFINEAVEITPKISRESFYHGPAGLYAVQSIVAAARGDFDVQGRATSQFIAQAAKAAQQTNAEIDLTLGVAGHLLGSAFLLDALGAKKLPPPLAQEKIGLQTFGRELYAQIWAILDGYAAAGEPPGPANPGLANLGIAHGWAGLLHVSLGWCAAAGEEIPASLQERLQQLAGRAEPAGRGLHWLWGGRTPMPGWCNGSAGFVFLWTAAHKALGEEKYADLAEAAAWSTWELSPNHGSLCCGLGGQAYALLNFYRHSGEKIWLSRAKRLAELAAEAQRIAAQTRSTADLDSRAESLYKGKVGIAALAADLDSPLEARMPFFERE